jgi:hypothetical protein
MVRGLMDRRRLREIRKANGMSINAVLRLAWIAGAEEQSRRSANRPLTDEELRQVIARYPHDSRTV